MTPIARHRLRQPGSVAGAVLLAVAAMLPCVAGSSPAADADARFRARLRAALPSSAASAPDQDRLLRMADAVAKEVYADLDRAAAAAREFQALPVATADWRTHEHGGARTQSAPAEMPLWAKPWSAVATTQHAVQWHEATTRPRSP